jgi:hypothetical protein
VISDLTAQTDKPSCRKPLKFAKAACRVFGGQTPGAIRSSPRYLNRESWPISSALMGVKSRFPLV